MNKSFALLVLPVLAGCFTAQIPEIARWPVSYVDQHARVNGSGNGVARMAQVSVRAPYDAEQMAVLRTDGTIAFDAYNEFAASPAQLMRGLVMDAVADSGLFKGVVGSGSIASTPFHLEVTVVKFALDCRQEGERKAAVELHVRMLEGKEIKKESVGSASVDAASGNYGAAFSSAASAAASAALRQLR